MVTMSRLEAARDYSQRGWHPVPLPPKEKRPVHKDWPSRDFATEGLAQHFSGDGNIGLKCGIPSGGLVDVDIDDECALRIANVFLPKTGMRHGRHGNPNSHRWFKVNDDPGKTQQFEDPDGAMLIELRSTGGQTLVPPSIHPTGDKVEWDEFNAPTLIDSAVLSAAVRKVAAAALIARKWPEEGSRHKASLALAGMLLHGGVADADAEEFIRAVAETAQDEEVEERVKCVGNTRQTINANEPTTGFPRLGILIGEPNAERATKWLQEAGVIATADPWGDPIYFSEQPPPPIPASLLPGALGTFAAALAAEAEVPDALPVMAILGTLSTALAKRVVVSPQQNWEESVNLYMAVALPPGNSKSLVLNRCTAPLTAWETNEQLRLAPIIAMERSRRKSEEQRIEQSRRDGVKEKNQTERNKILQQVAQDEAALQPARALPQLIANDTTPEALAMTLKEQDGRLAIISDEGGIMETMAGLYTGGSANVDVLLKGIDGGQVRIRRKNSESFNINPYLTMMLLVQPRILQNMAEQHAFRGNGTLERFLFVLPKSTLGYRSHNGMPVSTAIEGDYKAVIDRLLALPPNIVGGKVVKTLILVDGTSGPPTPAIVGGTAVPYTLTLSPAASQAWSRFRDEVEPMLKPTGRLADATGWGAKLPGFTLRIAGLLHMSVIGTQSLEIDDATMKSAIDLAGRLIDHAIAARHLMGTDQAAEDAKLVFEWLKATRREEFTRTECLNAHPGRLVSSKRMDALLTVLMDRNIIDAGEKLQKGGRGRPAREYRVNPQIYAN